MIFSKDVKNLKIYRRKMFLPTLEDSDSPNKKTKSAIFLLTPYRNSSISLMNHPLMVNMRRYQSYYIERDLTYFINSKVLKAEDRMEEDYAIGVPADDILNEDYIETNTTGLNTEVPHADIYYSGYINDINKVKQVFGNAEVQDIMSHFSNSQPYIKDKIMQINLIIGNQFDIDEKFFFWIHNYKNEEGKEVDNIRINVPRCAGEAEESYCARILNFVCKVLYIFFKPGSESTQAPMVFADTYTNADTKFNGANEEDYRENVYEASTPITIENLGRKFKYASTTKFKAQKSRKLNKMSKPFEDISFSPQITIPTVGASESALEELEEGIDYIRLGDDRVTIFAEDAKFDVQLRKILWSERIKKRQEIIAIDKQIKADVPWIKFAYPDLDKYAQKNLFVDLSYYNMAYFKNNTWTLKRGFDLYFDFLSRLINDPRLTTAGYTKKTIFIDILAWQKPNVHMWMYREDINPISMIYELMLKDPTRVKRLFGKIDLFFFDNDKYFKINFSEISNEDMKKMSAKFKLFLTKIVSKEKFDSEDEDTSVGDTPEAIKADIYDKIEDVKGIDLTPRQSKKITVLSTRPNLSTDNVSSGISATTKDTSKKIKDELKTAVKQKNEINQKQKEITNNLTDDGVESKNTASMDLDKKAQKEEELKRMADIIDNITSNSSDLDDALNTMEDNEELKKLLIDLDSSDDRGSLVSPARKARINDLETELQQKVINNVSIRELLTKEQDKVAVPTTSLKVDSINPEWQNMTYMNFDKTYDLNADIVSCFNHFAHVSLPFAIRNIKAEDTSTSEDRKATYVAEIEDFRGKRQTLKLDIPIPKDNRFMLRGNNKVIATQFVNMPIIKTDLDTCQIVTNYQKIFIRRHKTSVGRSNIVASRIIKALKKYEGRNLKITYGDNSRICNKYQLPIDYIDIASEIDTIEIPSMDSVIYFNQDTLREKYPQVDYSKGVPYVVNTKTNDIGYYTSMQTTMFATELLNILYSSGDQNIIELFNTAQPTQSGMYTRCNILNSKIPMVIIVSYIDGLETVMRKAGIDYELKDKLSREDRLDTHTDWIKYEDGYVVYRVTYASSLLMNGLKDCPTENYPLSSINQRSTYVEFLDDFGGRLKADGLDNFNDCLVDPITLEILRYYKMPETFVEILLTANGMLADNEYIKHTDTSSRRIRRAEQVAAYTYEALTEAYVIWANQIRHGRTNVTLLLKQSAVIDKLLQSPVSSDDSVNNALGALEETNVISFKGKSGLNEERSYSLDKRTFDDSMLNSIASSTNFSANAGVSRMSTVNMNIEGVRGFVKQIDSDTNKMNSVNTLSATENMIPFEATHDDNTRIHMSYIQTAKHQTRVLKSDPLLVTSGADEALPYLTTNKFAYKADKDGKIVNITDQYITVEYVDGTKDVITLEETLEKNSDGGYYVPMKLDVAEGIKAGMKIKAGQILAYDKLSFSNSLGESDNIAYNAGTLTKVAIINTDDGFEDSGICTQKLAKEMTTQVVYKFEKVIEKDSIIYQFAKKGQYVNVDDVLCVWQDPYDDYDINSIFRTMGDKTDLSELGRKVLTSDTTGTIVDIKIFRTCELKDMSPSVRKVVEEYEAPIKKLKAELEAGGFDTKALPATYALPTTGKLKKAEDAIYVEFYVQHDDIPGVGDKGTFFAANKFVIKSVIPEGKEPYTDFRPNEEVSAMLSVTSINKRMVTSIMLNGALNKLMVELDRSVKDILGIPYDDSKM